MKTRFHIYNTHEESCNICFYKALTRGELMAHRKKAQPKAIKLCRFFKIGACDFKDEVCWFSHEENKNSSIPQTLTKYKCGFCEEIYHKKSEFMKHRKTKHIEQVPVCRDGTWCNMGERCWYKHSEHEVNDENKEERETSQNMMKRIFDLMEKYGERIANIENML